MKQLRITGLWVILVVITIIAIQLALPDVVTIGPTWLVPFIELIGIPIIVGIITFGRSHSGLVRYAMTAFLVLLVLASVMNALLLLISLLNGFTEQGGPLLFAGFGVLIINVLSFGLVYWWIDAGGPILRSEGKSESPDFLFPQQGMDGMGDGSLACSTTSSRPTPTSSRSAPRTRCPSASASRCSSPSSRRPLCSRSS